MTMNFSEVTKFLAPNLVLFIQIFPNKKVFRRAKMWEKTATLVLPLRRYGRKDSEINTPFT